MNDLDLNVFETTGALAEAAATAIAKVLSDAVAAEGEASLVLTGGSTPAKIYEALATRSVPRLTTTVSGPSTPVRSPS